MADDITDDEFRTAAIASIHLDVNPEVVADRKGKVIRFNGGACVDVGVIIADKSVRDRQRMDVLEELVEVLDRLEEPEDVDDVPDDGGH